MTKPREIWFHRHGLLAPDEPVHRNGEILKWGRLALSMTLLGLVFPSVAFGYVGIAIGLVSTSLVVGLVGGVMIDLHTQDVGYGQ
jgi:hypothetical protein